MIVSNILLFIYLLKEQEGKTPLMIIYLYIEVQMEKHSDILLRSKTVTIASAFFWHRNMSLLLRSCHGTKHLLVRRELGNKLVPVRQALLHGFVVDIALRPLAELGVLLDREHDHPVDLLKDPEPVSQHAGRDVHNANGISSEEAPPLQLSLEKR